LAKIAWNRISYNLPKIVVLVGRQDSGKTTSIKNFLKSRNLTCKKRGDVKVVIPILRNGRVQAVGVASGGDRIDVIDKNFDFLIPRNCDTIVCAVRSSEQIDPSNPGISTSPIVQHLLTLFPQYINHFTWINQNYIVNQTQRKLTKRNLDTVRRIKREVP
jgi:hypothetical protein